MKNHFLALSNSSSNPSCIGPFLKLSMPNILVLFVKQALWFILNFEDDI